MNTSVVSFCRLSFIKIIVVTWVLLLLTGCASYGIVENQIQLLERGDTDYSISSYILNNQAQNDISVLLAFSGGGSRAAAFSYGVLKALRDTHIEIDGESRRLLDEVDIISSVSGGSFTAAYYGLYGEQIFDEFEEVFLTRNLEKPLVEQLYNPFRWFSSKGRTEVAVEYFDETIFHGTTFADMMRKRGQTPISRGEIGVCPLFT